MCSECDGGLERIRRNDQDVFFFCRACKLPHDEGGNALFKARSLAERFNPLQAARDTVRKTNPQAAPVTRTSLEVALLQTVQDAYFSGLKDGVLLAYSQDFEEGEPMEKLGVSNEELKTELRTKYNDLKEKTLGTLTKEASAQTQKEIDAVKAKLDELENLVSR
jgi:hypothetical protein